MLNLRRVARRAVSHLLHSFARAFDPPTPPVDPALEAAYHIGHKLGNIDVTLRELLGLAKSQARKVDPVLRMARKAARK